MSNDEKALKSLKTEVSQILKKALTEVDFEKHLVRLDDDDGGFYWALAPRTKLTYAMVDKLDDALIACVKLYQAAGVVNNNRYYKKVARMVHYAMSELEAKQSLEHTIEEMMGEDFNVELC